MKLQKKSAYYIIRALLRILIDGMKISIDDIIQILKTAAADIGQNELNLNDSEISSRTGIPRENIKKNLDFLHQDKFTKPSPALKVMLYWCSNPFYTDENHQPKKLTKNEFNDLCNSLVANIRPTSILKTLMDWKIINYNNKLLTIIRTNAVNKIMVEKTSSLTTSTCGLLNTYYLNTHVEADRRLRENVVFSNLGISKKLIPAINKELSKSMMSAYKKWNRIIEKYEIITQEKHTNDPREYPGAGMYQIQHTVSLIYDLDDSNDKSPIKEANNEI